MNKVLADRVLHEKICIIVRRGIDFFCARYYNRYIPKTKRGGYSCQDRHDAVEFVEYQKLMHSVPVGTDALSQSC